MKRGFLVGTLAAVSVLALPTGASATRPATDQEILEFKAAARVTENVTDCAVALSQEALASGSCPWTPRADYDPEIKEARVSTLDETWASALVVPAPHLSEARTVVFRHYPLQWSVLTDGQGCELATRSFGASNFTPIRLMPDLVEAMGCTPIIPTKVRCLDKFRTSLLSLEKPFQCAVAGPVGSPFPGWMNIRELRWRGWGAAEGARAIGVIRELPRWFLKRTKRRLSAPMPGPGISHAIPLTPISVRLTAAGMVSCGTAFFYSRLAVSSPFGRFEVALPTCPDQSFLPG